MYNYVYSDIVIYSKCVAGLHCLHTFANLKYNRLMQFYRIDTSTYTLYFDDRIEWFTQFQLNALYIFMCCNIVVIINISNETLSLLSVKPVQTGMEISNGPKWP